jgi:VanZ family protein
VSDKRQSGRNRLHFVLLAITVCFWTAMFAGTHWLELPVAQGLTNYDKLLHWSANCGLAFLIALCLSTWRPVGLKKLGGIFAVVFGYAIFDELSQIPVGRDCEFFDAVADCTGGLSGLAAFVTLRSAVQRLAPARANSRGQGRSACDSTGEVASAY